MSSRSEAFRFRYTLTPTLFRSATRKRARFSTKPCRLVTIQSRRHSLNTKAQLTYPRPRLFPFQYKNPLGQNLWTKRCKATFGQLKFVDGGEHLMAVTPRRRYFCAIKVSDQVGKSLYMKKHTMILIMAAMVVLLRVASILMVRPTTRVQEH